MDFPSTTQLLAAVPVIGALAALLNVAVATRNERRRTQPIVIARRDASSEEGPGHPIRLVNEGEGPAFNVRFGMTHSGARLPFRAERTWGIPNRIRIVRARECAPEHSRDAFRLLIDVEQFRAVRWSDLSRKNYYWCRYENVQGKTWETRNPFHFGADLEVRRVRFIRLVERAESLSSWRLARRAARNERRG
jgi:hypothetical protein